MFENLTKKELQFRKVNENRKELQRFGDETDKWRVTTATRPYVLNLCCVVASSCLHLARFSWLAFVRPCIESALPVDYACTFTISLSREAWVHSGRCTVTYTSLVLKVSSLPTDPDETCFLHHNHHRHGHLQGRSIGREQHCHVSGG